MPVPRLISRGSTLARTQVQEFLDRCAELGQIEFHIQYMESMGDQQKEVSLLEGRAPDDFFTRDLDQALLREEADWALHSAKDLPRVLPPGLKLWALVDRQVDREDRAGHTRQSGSQARSPETDSLVSHTSLEKLVKGSRIGTSSPKRKRQLLELRPDLEVVSLRGTIEERLGFVKRKELDGVIVATCALQRLGLDCGEILPFTVHPLQGYLGLVGRDEANNRLMTKCLEELDVRKHWGQVSLLGAGAGDPSLLTLGGQGLLRQADVVLYDALVNNELLKLAPHAKKIYVGKRRGNHPMAQEEISQQLWQIARQGKQVVRLKGGDALLFARAAEELQALSQAMVPYRVLPGISAAFAAAASLALPLTQRGNDGSSLHLLSAYPPEQIDFHSLPPHGNIIFYMGLSQRYEIQQRALEAGRCLQDPVLVVLWASLPQQKNLYTTLEELPQLAELENEKKAAGLILLGPIARPLFGQVPEKAQKEFSMVEQVAKIPQALAGLPNLQGKTWVTGLNPTMDPQTPLHDVWHLPLIALSERCSMEEELLRAIKRAELLLFTSKYAVRYFAANLQRSGYDLRLLGSTRIVSLGQATTSELQKIGLILREPHDWQSPEESSNGLLKEFSRRYREYGLQGLHIAIPCSSKALPTLTEGLSLGPHGSHSIERVLLYDNVLPATPLDCLSQNGLAEEEWMRVWELLRPLKAVYFSSPSTAEHFAEVLAKPLQRHLGAGFPLHWEYRCKGEPTRQCLSQLQNEYGLLDVKPVR